MSKHLLRRLSPLVRQVDFALDWTQVNAGKVVFKQGDPAAGIYIVLNGRVRSVVTISGERKEAVEE